MKGDSTDEYNYKQNFQHDAFPQTSLVKPSNLSENDEWGSSTLVENDFFSTASIVEPAEMHGGDECGRSSLVVSESFAAPTPLSTLKRIKALKN